MVVDSSEDHVSYESVEIFDSRVVNVRCVECIPACDVYFGKTVPYSKFYLRPSVRDTVVNSISMSKTKYSRYLCLVQGILSTEHSECGKSGEKMSCIGRCYVGEQTQEFQGHTFIYWLWVGAKLIG